MDSLGPHPHIIKFLGISSDQNFGPAIVTPWMEHGTLTDIICLKPPYEYRRRLASLIKSLFLSAHFITPLQVGQIVDGMSFLKASNIVHGDLKSSNILVAQDGRARIADFGLSHFGEPSYPSPPTGISALRIAAATFSWALRTPPSFDSATHAGAGSPRWMAPERLVPDQWGIISARATFQSDIFGLGMVLYEIYSENLPYHESNDHMAMIFIVQGKRPERPILIPDSLWCITTRCWAPNPFLRPSIDVIERAINAPEPLLENTNASYTRKESFGG
ncbi:hypothetical protein CVT25_005441 [Psilocybe cyanescens]|uniref:Protein kinase domain-containing protein n=1 Tax=Psilocybe cyanescens TaxID=93625 RepID=A0A409XBU6_PSICY|nr:hypothetical protein CVT25_005441 [Psilocybe cyanescens]